ncbi:MAG: hypothetical protein H6573_35935 [Lewinellaceae bacterium]|nr:hypothetical protein [Lewinellaceae bacterium]
MAFLRDLQLIQRRRRVVFSQAHDAVLVEVGEYEPRITKSLSRTRRAGMILVKVLRPVSCYLPTGIFRHHATIWRVYIPMINMGTQ